jgi:class 3 adenylate cyclase
MFTDIVGSTELLNVIGDAAWNDLKRWHDQTLRAVASHHAGEEINEAGDGFFFAFKSVVSAVDCAIAMQRALADHRRNAGFAPRIRIGLHAAEATRVNQSYVGQGVHEAARIGSAAGTSEIAASVDTLAGESITALGVPREVTLKGIAGPVWVQTIDWIAAES